jgi:NAD+ synthase
MNCELVKEMIVRWLDCELVKSKQNGFVVGVSGGIDSALVSTLCALTKQQVLLVSLSMSQKNDQLSRAQKHIDFLTKKFDNVKSIEQDITQTFEQFKSIFSTEIQENELVMANLISRIRMCVLYAYSGQHRYLVAGTGNKIEDFGIGFFTKYGDGGVDLSPIGDLSKTQVKELSKCLGVDDEILNAKPTDGLWNDNRSDEDQIGATYEELEWAMAINSFMSIKENKFVLKFSERQNEVLEIYEQRHTQNLHKNIPIPMCKISKIII